MCPFLFLFFSILVPGEKCTRRITPYTHDGKKIRMKRGLLYTCCRHNGYNKLVLAQHLDDLAESFIMSALHNGQVRQKKRRLELGEVRVKQPRWATCHQSIEKIDLCLPHQHNAQATDNKMRHSSTHSRHANLCSTCSHGPLRLCCGGSTAECGMGVCSLHFLSCSQCNFCFFAFCVLPFAFFFSSSSSRSTFSGNVVRLSPGMREQGDEKRSKRKSHLCPVRNIIIYASCPPLPPSTHTPKSLKNSRLSCFSYAQLPFTVHCRRNEIMMVL